MGQISVTGKLSLDGSGWEKALRQAEHQVNELGRDALGDLKGRILEAFTVGAIIEFGRKVVETATNIKHAAEQFGATTDQVQSLTLAAQRVGLTFDDVGRAISKFGAMRKKAGEEEGEDLRLLEKYGLTLDDVRNAADSNTDSMFKMMEAMKKAGETAQGRQELREMFGKGGDKLAAVFDVFKGRTSENSPHMIVSEEDIERIDQAEIKTKQLWDATLKGGMHVLGQIIYGWDMLIDRIHGRNALGLDKLIIGAIHSSSEEKPKEIIFPHKENKQLLEELHRMEEANRMAGLTHQEKILELQKEGAEVTRRLMSGENGDDLIKDQIRNLEIDTKIKELSAVTPGRGSRPEAASSLARTGNFLGVSANGIVSVGEQTNHLLRQIHSAIVNGRKGGSIDSPAGATTTHAGFAHT